jgi:peptidoglycan-associated lipoprotein
MSHRSNAVRNIRDARIAVQKELSMTVSPFLRGLAAAALCAGLLAGCSSVPLDEPAAPVVDKSNDPAAAGAADPRAVAKVDTTGGKAVDPLNDPANPLSKRSVFFDFDSFTVKPEYQSVVEAHGRYLAANKSRNIVIEGNTDERGGREYNLALGQKRAEAVKQRLQLLGVGDRQIETVSFGKEKPKALGSTDEAWAQNRRADIVYK